MLIQSLIPLGLFLIMLSMGLGLTVNDFKELLNRPKAVFVILLVQLLFLPLLAIAISLAIDLSPSLGLGLVLIASCPGGITSNMLTRLAKGDTALSIGLTAITSLTSVFIIPLIMGAFARLIGGELESFELSFLNIILQISALTALPLVIGMVLRNKYPDVVSHLESKMVLITALFFILLVVLTWIDQWENIKSSVNVAGTAVALLLVLSNTAGFLSGKIARLQEQEITTMLIEVGIQNGAMAFMIAATILNNMSIAIPSALYSVFMIIIGMVIVVVRRPNVA
ncbi:bile acid:sodium symporter family protein [Zhongshania aquimaris]|uniref:Bile acid:sodium symporter family protein n=1 Tax=Zhongshania aquimaris TaxID=2857107 RepID=A0ABS6VSN0_9GAMM|nr:bile acid:sodium symporter family protein [Zhongshania aquimaris]MBW2941326.1 bile acid:sodium symporter family protein [Zhongshania aquimaris]